MSKPLTLSSGRVLWAHNIAKLKTRGVSDIALEFTASNDRFLRICEIYKKVSKWVRLVLKIYNKREFIHDKSGIKTTTRDMANKNTLTGGHVWKDQMQTIHCQGGSILELPSQQDVSWTNLLDSVEDRIHFIPTQVKQCWPSKWPLIHIILLIKYLMFCTGDHIY